MSRHVASHVAFVVLAGVWWSVTKWAWGPEMGAFALWCCILGHALAGPTEDP